MQTIQLHQHQALQELANRGARFISVPGGPGGLSVRLARNDDYLDLEQFEDEAERMEAELSRAYDRAMARHPHCMDPDHPGCPACGWGEDECEEREDD